VLLKNPSRCSFLSDADADDAVDDEDCEDDEDEDLEAALFSRWANSSKSSRWRLLKLL
jgi:hypothetical protein